MGSAAAMTPGDGQDDGQLSDSRPQALRPLAVEPSIAPGSTLARIYQSLADFTELTRLVRAAVDEQLGKYLQVTGWKDGELRVHLERPALATRWRFQEPGVRQALLRHPSLKTLRHIRLVTTHLGSQREPTATSRPSTLRAAPVDVLREMAASESHPALRAALLRLYGAASAAKAGASPVPLDHDNHRGQH